MGKRFIEMILAGILSLCLLSPVHAALTWPDNLELDPAVLAQGNVGDILAEISLHLMEGWDLHNPPNNGLVSLAIQNHQGVYSENQGVYSVTEDDSIGIAFIGTITFNYGSKSYTGTKDAWNSELVSHSSGWTKAEALIRAHGTKSGNNHSVSLSGKLVFVRLKTGPITASVIKYPRLIIEYRASGSGPGDTYIELFSVNSTGGNISIPRTCSVVFNGMNVDFGNIKDNVPKGSVPLAYGSSAVSVQCDGVSSQTTQVNLSVRSLSGQVSSDPSAIPLVMAMNTDNYDLVVKATLGSSTPDCLSGEVLSATETQFESKWLNVLNGTEYNIFSFTPTTTALRATKVQPINWYLCRRFGAQALQIGDYSGSALLSITLN